MIDWCRVADLRAEVGDDGFSEIVSLFLEETYEVIGRLRGGDRTALARDLHFLKGSALNLGFEDMAALCLAGERLCNSGNPAGVRLEEIIQVYVDSRSALETALFRDSAA